MPAMPALHEQRSAFNIVHATIDPDSIEPVEGYVSMEFGKGHTRMRGHNCRFISHMTPARMETHLGKPLSKCKPFRACAAQITYRNSFADSLNDGPLIPRTEKAKVLIADCDSPETLQAMLRKNPKIKLALFKYDDFNSTKEMITQTRMGWSRLDPEFHKEMDALYPGTAGEFAHDAIVYKVARFNPGLEYK